MSTIAELKAKLTAITVAANAERLEVREAIAALKAGKPPPVAVPPVLGAKNEKTGKVYLGADGPIKALAESEDIALVNPGVYEWLITGPDGKVITTKVYVDVMP